MTSFDIIPVAPGALPIDLDRYLEALGQDAATWRPTQAEYIARCLRRSLYRRTAIVRDVCSLARVLVQGAALMSDRAFAWRLASIVGHALPRPSRPLAVKLRAERDFLRSVLARSAHNHRPNLRIAAAVGRLDAAHDLLENSASMKGLL